MKRSFLGTIVLAAMFLAGFSVKAQNYLFADTSANGQVLYYDTIDGAARVVSPLNGGNYNGHTEPTGDIVIPDSVTWNGTAYAVRYIGSRAFYSKRNITSVVIGNEVEEIGDMAFQWCDTMTSAVLGAKVTTLGMRAFGYCESLASFNFPATLTTIGQEAFLRCFELTEVTLPVSLTTIGPRAFLQTGIAEIAVPATVTTIGSNAFSGIRNVLYTGTATGSPWGAFALNAYLYDSVFYTSSALDTVVAGHPNLVVANLPSSVVCIAGNGLRSCTQLRRVMLPEGLQSLCEYAFSGCTALDSVVIPTSVTSLPGEMFWNCSGLTSVTLPEGLTSLGEWLFQGCTSLTRITLPSTLDSLGFGVFNSCSSLDSVVVPPSVTHFGPVDFNNMFRGCTSLTHVVLPPMITYIGEDAFYECRSLRSIDIPATVTHIYTGAFSDCDALREVVIPDAVTQIDQSAFRLCDSLHKVTIGRGVRELKHSAFFNCQALDTVIWLADSCASPIYNVSSTISYHAFDQCTSLRVLIVDDSVTMLPDRFMQPVTTLRHLVLGASLQEVGYCSFDNCTLLDTITCRSLVPPNSSRSRIYSFWHVPYTTTVVEVPCQAIDDYRDDGGWSEFTNLRSYGTGLTLTLAVNSDIMGEVSQQGIHCDSTVTVVATPHEGYFLAGWSDGGTGTVRTLTLVGDSSLVAIFAIADTFNITVTPTAGVTYYGDGQYLTADTAVLFAVPEALYRFDGWSDGDTSNPRYVCVTSDSTFAALFTPMAVVHDTLHTVDTAIAYQHDTLTLHTDTTITVEQWQDIYIHDTIFVDSVVTVEVHVTDTQITPNSELTTPNSPKTTISYTTAAGHVLQFSTNADGVSVTATSIAPGTANQNDTLYIPDTVTYGGNAYAVTRIGYSAFYGLIRYVVLPPTMRTIYTRAFYNGERLRYIYLPEGLDTIGSGAFWYCSVLDSIIIPNSVRYIGENAFENCFALQKAVMPQGLKVVPYSCFGGCGQLHSVDLGDSLEVIQPYAFADTRLDSIVLPATLQSIGSYAFYYEWVDNPTQMVRLLGTVPPTTQPDFDRSGLLTGTIIRVPCEAIGTYMTDTSWSMFTNLRSYGIGVEVSVSASIGGSARVVQHPDCDSTVIIAAVPNSGYRFVGWTDGSLDNPRIVQLEESSHFHAQFIVYRPLITAEVIGNGTVYGTGSYALGSSVPLSALPAFGSYFIDWGDSNTMNPRPFTTTVDTHFVARFGSSSLPQIHDTVVVVDSTVTIWYTITDTLTAVDTLYDTVFHQNLLRDTTYIVRLVYDTVYVHDTVYVDPPTGIADIDTDDIVVRSEQGAIVVSSSETHDMVLFDVSGRKIGQGRGTTVTFRIPASGVYLLRVDALPARRIVAIR